MGQMSHLKSKVSTDPDLPVELNEAKGRERVRLSAEDWERAALELIATEGVSAVAVEPLAKRLNVTKGSFYWHFGTRDALLEAAINRWEQDDRGDLLERVGAAGSPRDRLSRLIRLTSRTLTTHQIMAALLKSLDHPLVGPVMERVNANRLNLLTRIFNEAGLSEDEAAHRARVAYTAYVGFLQLAIAKQMPRISRGQFDEYVEHIIALLVPSNCA
jgi:AcrR family transcriptional regulator